ncbi:cache domain-containing sensor histidine kinase [Paenibacillus endoradicis]|uniref:cache domain-containing sensor histidine kinase n=1 Tax=Paenibacillus endoradicis TaxID=2972487 RepID=UPI002158FD19|nr:sensor histidine kinase [Paenibacillus endoradicis]MCR8657556.1 sensor histidine kinase [Paenibacillus endoradicis]
MTFIRKWWNSVFVKFSMAFLLVGLLPLIALSIFSLQAFTGHVQQFTVNNLKQMSMYMSYNINNVFLDYDEITRLMYTGRYEGYSHSISVNQTENVNHFEQINDLPIDAFLKTVLYSDKHIRSVYFVRSLDNKVYYQTRQSKPFEVEKLPLELWSEPLIDRPNQLSIYPTHSEDYYGSPNKKVITFGRNLIDINGILAKEHKVVGSLFIDVDASVLDVFLQELNLSKDDELYVLDGDQRIYYSNREDILKADTENLYAHAEDENYLIFSGEVPYLSGQVLMRVSSQNLFNQLKNIQSTIYVAIIVCSIVLLAMGTLFSRRLSSPILNILKHMNKVEMGNLDIQITKYSKDEIGRLAFGFNKMVERLKLFINDAYIAEIKQKQAELNALKSQIRPHYLYNTLEVIRMNAVYKDDGEVADMILALSNQLKYVIDYGEDWVSIQEELDHLNDYFHIIRVRYENRIELRLNIAEDVRLDWQILKLSLQPIVENAIQHGILYKGGKGTVLVTLEVVEDRLSVTVYDDGAGISEARLHELMKRLSEPKAPSKNVGIKNVHDRIKSVCGDEYGLSISSVEHIGTSVCLLLPITERHNKAIK